jgi:hypothetical protein
MPNAKSQSTALLAGYFEVADGDCLIFVANRAYLGPKVFG